MRDSVYNSNVGGTTTPELTIVDYDLISGVVDVDITDGDSSTKVRLDFQTSSDGGSSWSTIDSYTHTGANSFTRRFSFSNITGADKFRVRLVAVNVVLPTQVEIGEYDAQQYVSEFRITKKGIGFLGGNVRFLNQPVNPGSESIDQMEDKTLYLEPDGNGHYNLKAK
jgi:hypothetical protein